MPANLNTESNNNVFDVSDSTVGFIAVDDENVIIANQSDKIIFEQDSPNLLFITVGEQGPAGTDSDKSYVHVQILPSDVWEISHNLNKKPSVTVVDSGESVVIGDINYIDFNNLNLIFSAGFSGKAYLN